MNILQIDKVTYGNKPHIQLTYISGVWKPEVNELLLPWVPYIERNEDSVVMFVKEIKLAKKLVKYLEAYLDLLDDRLFIEDRLGIYDR
jgi:hypothetical protein